MQACDSEIHQSEAPLQDLGSETTTGGSSWGFLLGHKGSIPVSEGNVILRLAAVVPTSGCGRDCGLPEGSLGTEQLPGCGTGNIILGQGHLLGQVVLQRLGNQFLE